MRRDERIAQLEAEVERLRPLAEVAELAEALFKAGALDDVTVADARFAEVLTRIGGEVTREEGDS